MRFINRKKELETLEVEYRKEQSFVVLYGRRRTGKTSLIRKFIENKNALYFYADTQSETIQMLRFKSQMAQFLNDPVLENIEFSDWEVLFRYLTGHRKDGSKMILVIDEFQYLCKVNKDFSSIFQRIWDTLLSQTGIMVILCGSLIGMMYEHALSYESPLYGRRTAQIKLAPIPFIHYREFFSNRLSVTDLIRFYAVTGGIPKYIESLESHQDDLYQGIENAILNKNSMLYAEPRFLLMDEVNEYSTYFSILQTISQGEHKVGNIAKRMNIQVNNLTSFLTRLQELDLLEKQVPVTEENPAKSRRGLYFIKDHFIHFWFTYVFAYQSYLEIENTEYVMAKIRSGFNQLVSFVFEKICLEMIPYLSLPFEILKTGRWWNDQNEIDIAVIGQNQELLLGECKWWEDPVGLNVLNQLKEKAVSVPFNYARIYWCLFSKSGFTEELKTYAGNNPDVLLVDLEMISSLEN